MSLDNVLGALLQIATHLKTYQALKPQATAPVPEGGSPNNGATEVIDEGSKVEAIDVNCLRDQDTSVDEKMEHIGNKLKFEDDLPTLGEEEDRKAFIEAVAALEEKGSLLAGADLEEAIKFIQGKENAQQEGLLTELRTSDLATFKNNNLTSTNNPQPVESNDTENKPAYAKILGTLGKIITKIKKLEEDNEFKLARYEDNSTSEERVEGITAITVRKSQSEEDKHTEKEKIRTTTGFKKLDRDIISGIVAQLEEDSKEDALKTLESIRDRVKAKPKAERGSVLEAISKEGGIAAFEKHEKNLRILRALTLIATQGKFPSIEKLSPTTVEGNNNTDGNIQETPDNGDNTTHALKNAAFTFPIGKNFEKTGLEEDEVETVASLMVKALVTAKAKAEAFAADEDDTQNNAHKQAYDAEVLRAKLQLHKNLLYLHYLAKNNPERFSTALEKLKAATDPGLKELDEEINNSLPPKRLSDAEIESSSSHSRQGDVKLLNDQNVSDQIRAINGALDKYGENGIVEGTNLGDLEDVLSEATKNLKLISGTGSRFRVKIPNPFAKIPNPFKRRKNVQNDTEAVDGEAEVNTENVKKPSALARLTSRISALLNRNSTEAEIPDDKIDERKEPANTMEKIGRNIEKGWRNRQGSIGSVLLLLLGGAIAGAVVFALVANPFGMGLVGIGIGVVATGVAMGVLIRLTGFNVRTLLTPLNRLGMKSLKNTTELDIHKRVGNRVISKYLKDIKEGNQNNPFPQDIDNYEDTDFEDIEALIDEITDDEEKRKIKGMFNAKYRKELRKQRFRRRAILALEVVGFIIAAVVVAVLFKELMASAALLFATEAVLAKVIVPAVVVGLCGTGVCIDGCKEMYSWGLWSKLKSKMKSSQRAAGDENQNQNNRPKPTNLNALAALNTDEITVDNLDLADLKANPFTEQDVIDLNLNDPDKEAALKGIIPALQNNTLALEVNQPAPKVERTENVLAKLSGSEAISNKIEDDNLVLQSVEPNTQLEASKINSTEAHQKAPVIDDRIIALFNYLKENYPDQTSQTEPMNLMTKEVTSQVSRSISVC